ncbi:MAG TPA: zinc-binding dehydrogenase, partial [Kofleriaceae bacterium]|nr:zinc-binding dehydrogenase [Kofleriaceae bacterium]
YVGAEVVGLTTSPHKKSFIEALGATAYTVDEFHADTSLRGYDLVINSSGGAAIEWQRRRLGMTGRIICLGMSSMTKNGKRSYVKIASALLRTPRISVLKLFDANTGVYALNALHILQDPTWIERLTSSMADISAMALKPHVGKVFEATEVAAAHAFLETKQATGKVLLHWS